MSEIITFFWLMVGIIAFIVIAVAIAKRVDANDRAKYTAELRKIRFASLSSQFQKAGAFKPKNRSIFSGSVRKYCFPRPLPSREET